MKSIEINKSLPPFTYLVFVSVLLICTFFSTPVHSDPITSNINIVNNSIQQKSIQIVSLPTKPAEQKKILLEEPRNLSAFFILGIVINIVMFIIFAWWFAGQWKKTKH